MKVDYIIVGQGLAGSLLAWQLLDMGQRVLVVDRDEASTSSKVAAGLVTPIAGQQFSLPASIDTVLPYALQTYWDIEEIAGQTFYHHLPIARLFRDEAEVPKWQKRESVERYADYYADLEIDRSAFHADYGGIEVRKGGWLDVPAFLKAIRQHLLERLGYAIGRVHGADIDLSDELGVRWQNVSARGIIFCEGWRGSENPYFQNIDMNNARGDILKIECPQIDGEQRIINRNGWLLPMGNGRWRAGSTYDHHYVTEDPTRKGRQQVEEKIGAILRYPFEVVSHSSAIRPIISRSRAYMGRHPQHPEVAYMNGLGSKGVLNGPLQTRRLAEHLVEGKPLPEEHDIREHFEF